MIAASAPGGALGGLVVLERADRLATGLCGTLLAELGATVVRAGPERGFPDLTHEAAVTARAVVRAGKLCIDEPMDDRTWQVLVERADLLLLSPLTAADQALAEREAGRRVVCSITSFGIDARERSQAPELVLQAEAGIMGSTGHPDGWPEFVGVPLIESLAALNAATASLAALRVQRATGRPQLVDIAGFDSSLAIFSTFVSTVATGKKDCYRLGAGHHLCAPWNAYRTADGWIQLCTASDDEWRRLVEAMGHPAGSDDPRFATTPGRLAAVAAVDAVVGAWIGQRGSAEVRAVFAKAGLPFGEIHDVPSLLRQPSFQARSGSFLKLGRTPGREAPVETASAEAVLQRLPQRAPAPAERPPQAPLAGIRVLEIGPYTAGPLSGRYLAELGAEVIKVEPPGGEVSRPWTPRFGDVGGFFVNVNCGKKYLTLDLKAPADREILLQLARGADVLLENLRPGALTRMGLGPEALAAVAPRLVYCSISGFGADAGTRAALDTVVQAEFGLMSLIGEPGRPQRVGVSAADQSAAHAAPFAILAALFERERSGHGQSIDIAMRDVAAWLTRLTWPEGKAALRPWARLQAADGWCVADAPVERLNSTAGLSRAQLVEHLGQQGIAAAPVLEMGEVFAHEAVTRRGLVQPVGPADLPLLTAPFRLTLTPPRPGRHYAAADADRAELLG